MFFCSTLVCLTTQMSLSSTLLDVLNRRLVSLFNHRRTQMSFNSALLTVLNRHLASLFDHCHTQMSFRSILLDVLNRRLVSLFDHYRHDSMAAEEHFKRMN